MGNHEKRKLKVTSKMYKTEVNLTDSLKKHENKWK